MLAGRTESWITKAGQNLADQFAYGRINRQLTKEAARFIRSNKVPWGVAAYSLVKSLMFALTKHKSLLVWPNLFLFHIVRGELLEEFVPQIRYWKHLHRSWGGASRVVSDVKTLTKKLIQSDRLPDLAYFVNGNWFDSTWRQVDDVFVSELIAQKGDVVVKRDYSERGYHVKFLSPEEFFAFDFEDFGDCVVQKRIRQHSSLENLAGGGTVTLRLVTAFPSASSGPRLVAGMIYFHQDVAEHRLLRIPIDLGTNRIRPNGIDGNMMLFASQDLGVTAGQELHGLGEAKNLVLSLHSRFPHFQLVGWDLGIDEIGLPWLFEWNADHPAILHQQLFDGATLFRAGLDLTSR
jgi:hypothetical protein